MLLKGFGAKPLEKGVLTGTVPSLGVWDPRAHPHGGQQGEGHCYLLGPQCHSFLSCCLKIFLLPDVGLESSKNKRLCVTRPQNPVQAQFGTGHRARHGRAMVAGLEDTQDGQEGSSTPQVDISGPCPLCQAPWLCPDSLPSLAEGHQLAGTGCATQGWQPSRAAESWAMAKQCEQGHHHSHTHTPGPPIAHPNPPRPMALHPLLSPAPIPGAGHRAELTR